MKIGKLGLKSIVVIVVGLVAGCGVKVKGPGDRKAYIVVYKKTSKAQGFQSAASVEVKSNALSEVHDLSAPQKTFSVAIQGGVFELSEDEVIRVLQDDTVAYIEEDGPVYASAVQNNATWGLDRLDQATLPLNGKFSYPDGGSNVNVYVIDTGVKTNHQEFQGRAKSGIDLVDRDTNADDCNGHGTHVAGTIAGRNYGVAKNATVFGVRVLDCAGSGRISDVIAGVDWVTQNHQKPAVANMSLGGGASQALDDAVRNSIQSGVTYAIAAGNENAIACGGSPGRVSEALTVGATTKTDQRSSFSNHGICIDIFAPGSAITSAWIGNASSTNTIDGTSMAAPHVAGVAALYLSQNQTATPAQVAAAILQNATNNRVSDVRSGSPNRLLSSSFIVAGPGGGTPSVPPSDGSLRSGDLVNDISRQKGSLQRYKIKTNSSGGKLSVKIYGGTGDADLYVKFGSNAELNSYECRPYLAGNVEACEISGIAQGEYHILIHAYDTYSKLSMKVEISADETTGAPCTQCAVESGQLVGSGHFQLHPRGTYYQSTRLETHSVFLRADSNSLDFDLYLKKWDGVKWVTVSSSASAGGEENLRYQGGPGFYTIEVKSFLGSGSYKVYRKQGE